MSGIHEDTVESSIGIRVVWALAVDTIDMNINSETAITKRVATFTFNILDDFLIHPLSFFTAHLSKGRKAMHPRISFGVSPSDFSIFYFQESIEPSFI
jgi:NAD(P)H-flavin reductase